MQKRKNYWLTILGCLAIMGLVWLMLRLFGWYPYVVSISIGILLGLILCGFIFRCLLSRLAPRLVATRRLERFIRQERRAYIAHHADPEAAPDFCFDTVITRHDGLARLIFSDVSQADDAKAMAQLDDAVSICFFDDYGRIALRFTGTLSAALAPNTWQIIIRQGELPGWSLLFDV